MVPMERKNIPVDEFNVVAAEDRVGTGGAVVVESCVKVAAVVGEVTAVEAVEPALLTSQGFGGDGIVKMCCCWESRQRGV